MAADVAARASLSELFVSLCRMSLAAVIIFCIIIFTVCVYPLPLRANVHSFTNLLMRTCEKHINPRKRHGKQHVTYNIMCLKCRISEPMRKCQRQLGERGARRGIQGPVATRANMICNI